MLIVDDCTRWMDFSILKSKDQAAAAFAKFKVAAENKLGHKVKVLRSDRGGEFLSGIFRNICELAGINRQLTAPYSPQQNGVVERRNRTTMEMARSLLQRHECARKALGRSRDALSLSVEQVAY